MRVSAPDADQPFGPSLDLATGLPGPTGSRTDAGKTSAETGGVTPSALFNARQGPLKAMLVLREGGSVESEAAVEAGLDWLARHQSGDGHWGLDISDRCRHDRGCPGKPQMESHTAATGLGLLPFLAAGHTHNQPGRYRYVVDRGLNWLVHHQKKDGDLFTGGGGHMYSHAIATMALCEAYGITGDPALRTPAQRAIDFIAKAQHPKGGWRYEPGQDGDTSVLGWQMFALRSGLMAGLNVTVETIQGADHYLDRAAVDADLTAYAYQPGNKPTPVMTAEALLVRQYLGWSRQRAALRKGVGLVAAHLFSTVSKERNVYYWYYATQLFHNMDGDYWERWNPVIRDGLVATQVQGKGCDRGSWDPTKPSDDQWGVRAGRLFETSLSLLTLEVYYRYLPLYRQGEDNPVSALTLSR